MKPVGASSGRSEAVIVVGDGGETAVMAVMEMAEEAGEEAVMEEQVMVARALIPRQTKWREGGMDGEAEECGRSCARLVWLFWSVGVFVHGTIAAICSRWVYGKYLLLSVSNCSCLCATTTTGRGGNHVFPHWRRTTAIYYSTVDSAATFAGWPVRKKVSQEASARAR